jgi:hypothetical protein
VGEEEACRGRRRGKRERGGECRAEQRRRVFLLPVPLLSDGMAMDGCAPLVSLSLSGRGGRVKEKGNRAGGRDCDVSSGGGVHPGIS